MPSRHFLNLFYFCFMCVYVFNVRQQTIVFCCSSSNSYHLVNHQLLKEFYSSSSSSIFSPYSLTHSLKLASWLAKCLSMLIFPFLFFTSSFSTFYILLFIHLLLLKLNEKKKRQIVSKKGSECEREWKKVMQGLLTFRRSAPITTSTDYKKKITQLTCTVFSSIYIFIFYFLGIFLWNNRKFFSHHTWVFFILVYSKYMLQIFLLFV